MKLNTITFNCEFDQKLGLNVDFNIDNSISCETFFGTYGFVVNPDVLFSTFFKGTSDYLFSCSCGTPGCSGIYCECSILHHEELVIWLIPNPVSVETFEYKPIDCSFDIFRFNRRIYREYLKELAINCLQKTGFTNSEDYANYYLFNYMDLKTKLGKITTTRID